MLNDYRARLEAAGVITDDIDDAELAVWAARFELDEEGTAA